MTALPVCACAHDFPAAEPVEPVDILSLPGLAAALIRDAENEFKAACDAEGDKRLPHKNPLRRRREDAFGERRDARDDLANILCERPRNPDHMPAESEPSITTIN